MSTITADDEPHALLRLLASGARAGALRRLLDSHGSAAAAVAAGPRDWASHGLNDAACRAIRTPDAATLAHGERWLRAPDRQLIGWRDSDYPPLLRRIASPLATNRPAPASAVAKLAAMAQPPALAARLPTTATAGRHSRP